MDRLFVLGNGTAFEVRSDAMVVLKKEPNANLHAELARLRARMQVPQGQMAAAASHGQIALGR